MGVIVSRHAKKRIKQRVHKNWQRAADQAWQLGVDHGRLNGGLKRYVDWVAIKGQMHASGISAFKIYYNNIYLFSGEILVTVMHVPTRWAGPVQAPDRSQRRRV